MTDSKNFDSSFTSLRHAALPRYMPQGVDSFASGHLSPPTGDGRSPEDTTLNLDKLFANIPTVPVPAALAPQHFAHGTRENEAQEGRAIWQLHNKYILSQIRTGLMIVDQHVAHERVLYERALSSFENAVPVSQQLLFPQTLELSAGDFSLAKDLIPHLQALGFELKLFG